LLCVWKAAQYVNLWYAFDLHTRVYLWHAFDFIYKSMQCVVTKIMKWSHKALKWKTSVDNHRPLSLSLIWVFVLVDIFEVFFFGIQILNVHLRLKSLFCQIQNSVLKFNYAQCVILFAPSHVLFIQLSRNFASFFLTGLYLVVHFWGL